MERRLAAILAADVVGYSRLMEQDEAGTFERLRVCRKEVLEPAVARHRGRIFKLMGDGILAEFGSVVDAVACAVAMQRDMTKRNTVLTEGQRIVMRMAVNLGDVIVEGEDRHGDGVNIASRLEALAEPGGIVVSETVVEHVRNKLTVTFEPMGDHQVKNISQLIAVYRVSFNGSSATVAGRRGPRRARLFALGALIAAASAMVVLSNLLLREISLPTPPAPSAIATASAPSLAVLPFKNLSGDPKLEYFADGVTETLITELSRSPDIRVVSRTSTFAYKDKPGDIREIAGALGARYLVEGSILKGSRRIRIVAQLVDAETGDNLWAERYEREDVDVLNMQDQIIQKIVASLAGDQGLVKKKEYEKEWGRDVASLEEYDYYLRGHQLLYRFKKEDTLGAIEVWRQGLAKFPNSALLRIELAWGYYQLVYGGWSTDIAGNYRRAYDLVQEGLAGSNLSPLAEADAHFLLAYLEVEYKRDWDRGLREREIALALAPNDPITVASMAEIAIRAGEPDEAIASLIRDLEWDPNSQFASREMRLGWAYMVKGDYRRALEYLKLDLNANPVWTLPFLAVTYVELGMMPDARATVDRIRAANPAVTLAFLANIFSYRDPAIEERFLAALQKAGLPT